MQSAKTAALIMMLVCMSISLSGCDRDSSEAKFYGTWDVSSVISGEEFKRLSEGIDGEMVVKGTQTYHKGGKYTAEAEVTMRFTMDRVEMIPPLRVYMRDAGEWKLHGNGKELVETSLDGVLTPLDESTEVFIEMSPEVAAAFKPIKGQTITSRIISISDNFISQQENQTQMIINLKKRP